MKGTQRFAVAAGFAAFAIASAAQAAPCGGFTDVDSADPVQGQFCANVEWLKNRSVTLGCATNLYCPTSFVTRSEMAAFMNRLGDALTPKIFTNTDAFASYDLDLLESDPNAHLCKVGPIAPVGYPQRAIIYAQFSGYAGGALQMFGTTSASQNGGAFARTAPGGIGMRASTSAAGWVNVTQTAVVDLSPGTSYQFAFLVLRAQEDAALNDIVSLGGPLGGGRCNMTVQVGSRTGTSSPFDASGTALDNPR